MLQYKGFFAHYHYVVEASVFVGEVVNIPEVVAFSAPTLAALREVMIDAIENYLGTYFQLVESV